MGVVTLHDELVGASAPACKLCAFLATRTPEDAEAWQKELALPVSVVGNTAVERALGKRGVDTTEMSVRRHRTHHVPR